MVPTHKNFKLGLLLLVGCLLTAQTARADNPCVMSDGYVNGRGIGGTGLVAEGRGIGGTGRMAEGRGIGGTGLQQGDTSVPSSQLAYISGTIYAYGSVCVNGLRIKYDDQTPVVVNGAKGTYADLGLGEVVSLVATPDMLNEGMLKAREIRINSAVQGPVTLIDRDSGTLVVMGERVKVADPRSLPRLQMGDKVRINGLRDASGQIIASRLERQPQSVPDFVTGPVRLVANRRAMIGLTRVDLPEIAPLPKVGEVLQVSGKWSGQALSAEAAHEASLSEPAAKGTFVSVEGYVKNRRPNGRFSIGDNRTVYLEGNLNEGERLIVSGRVDQSGELELEEAHEPTESVSHLDDRHHEAPPAPADNKVSNEGNKEDSGRSGKDKDSHSGSGSGALAGMDDDGHEDNSGSDHESGDNSGSDDEGSDDSGSEDSGSGDGESEDGGSDDGESDDSGSEDSGSDDGGSDGSGSDDSGSDDSGSDDSGSDDSGSDDSGSDDSGSDDSGSDDSESDDSSSDNSGSDDEGGSDDSGSDDGGSDDDSGGDDK